MTSNADVVLPPLPQTLLEWRNWGDPLKGIVPRLLWNHLEEFFRQQGFILWKRVNSPCLLLDQIPPNHNPRCPDGYAYRLPSCDYPELHPGSFYSRTPILCAARTLDDRDVVIRLVVKGEDGLNHLEALKRLSTGYTASRGENHAVPVYKFIYLEDMVFAVTPLMTGDYFYHPWYVNINEVYDAIEQVLEGVTFMHENLVAHLDLDTDNFLTNYCAGPIPGGPDGITPFRSLFPIRYYINDFELAVCFDKDSDPATRLITGIPPHRVGRLGEYGRSMAPEYLLDKPYCPFRADIFQLGKVFSHFFGQITSLPKEMKDLFLLMGDATASSRPSASEALTKFRGIRRATDLVTLSQIPETPPPRWTPDDKSQNHEST